MIRSDEQRLLYLLQQDDTAAVKEIFDQYHAALCQVSYRLVQDQDEAKDIVQEVFFKLWKNRKSLQVQSSLFAYLKRAVVNTSFNSLEKHKKWSRETLLKIEESSFSHQDSDQQQLADELAGLAEKAIANLPARTQTVFKLIRSEEMSYREVAETLQISTKAVEKEMMKALRLLRLALKDYLPMLLLSSLIQAML